MEVPQGLNSQMLHNSGALRPTPVSRTSSQSSTTLASQRGRVRSTSWADIVDEEDEDLLGHLAGGRPCTCLPALLRTVDDFVGRDAGVRDRPARLHEPDPGLCATCRAGHGVNAGCKAARSTTWILTSRAFTGCTPWRRPSRVSMASPCRCRCQLDKLRSQKSLQTHTWSSRAAGRSTRELDGTVELSGLLGARVCARFLTLPLTYRTRGGLDLVNLSSVCGICSCVLSRRVIAPSDLSLSATEVKMWLTKLPMPGRSTHVSCMGAARQILDCKMSAP